MSFAASPGAAMSAADTSAVAGKAGRAGATMSVSVSFSIPRPLSVPSRTRRSVSLRPLMPAAPVIRMCIVPPHSRLGLLTPPPAGRDQASQRHAAVDQMRLSGDVARLVRGEEDREVRHLLRLAEPSHGLAVDEGLLDGLQRFAGGLRDRRDAL